MDERVNQLVERLSQVKCKDNLHNMYYGKKGEPFRKNLTQYLNEMLILKPSRLFVGEAAGPNGARRTGIPFTDEVVLSSRPMIIGDKKIFTGNYYLPFATQPLVSENSGKCVWESFIQLEELPLLWNANPFYAHHKGDFMKLRNPNNTEIRELSCYIKEVLEIFPGIKYFVAIGRQAQIGLIEALNWPPYIKHPSRNSSHFKENVQEIINNNFGEIVR